MLYFKTSKLFEVYIGITKLGRRIEILYLIDRGIIPDEHILHSLIKIPNGWNFLEYSSDYIEVYKAKRPSVKKEEKEKGQH